MRTIYLDIETIPGDTKPELEEVKVSGVLKDPEKIAKAQAEGQEKQWREEALKFYKGRIICLAYAIENQRTEVLTGTEESILKQFNDVLVDLGKDVYSTEFVGHNILFDAKFILNKARLYGCQKIKDAFPEGRYDKRLICTMQKFVLGDYKDLVSLDNMAKFFGVECKSTMKGSEVFDYWQADRLQEIFDYCVEDVNVVREIYDKYLR